MNTLFHARFTQAVQLILKSRAQLHLFFGLIFGLIFDILRCSVNQKAIMHIQSQQTGLSRGTSVDVITFNTEFISHNAQ